ncbi:DUF4919 domain-containing protein [Pontibacter pamirensis]|uniref:DUF4919 domain-containing protein n=1 Tax=Pontibacter pamirensis TaxID=2562824 RepID=UPI001389B3BC|nr:DUF4919 domain-containing protein [Pontibacter pamirensis]
MKQALVILFTLLSMLSGYAQSFYFEKPDYKKIEKAIKVEGSNYYYSALMERYNRADTTMTLDEKRHLYYGYSFQPKYSPYDSPDFADSLRAVLQKDQHSDADLKRILKYGDLLLADNPFDLRAINYQLYALEKLEKQEAFRKRLNQMNITIEALLSSGDGLKKESAFYVIYTTHEYDLLNILGFQFGGQQSLIEHYDYLKVAENPSQVEGMYFDVSPCLNSLNKMFK